MRMPSPNLIRYVRPARLQLWCAQRGILTGRWTQEQIDEVNARAAQRAAEARELFGWPDDLSDPE